MNHTSTSIRMKQKQKWGRLFVLPACLVIFCFVVYPLVYTFYLSFTDYNFAYDLKPTFVGLQNYINMFSDKLFIEALSNTLLLSAISFVLMMVLSLALALLLYKKTKHSWFYRTSIFMPIVVPASLVCLLFSWMLGNNFGIFNKFLIQIGLPKLVTGWLTCPWRLLCFCIKRPNIAGSIVHPSLCPLLCPPLWCVCCSAGCWATISAFSISF